MPLIPVAANEANIRRAAAHLRDGRLVAFPTETVYGLGADARNGEAVARIFAAKGRPTFNPLIAHVPDTEAAHALVDFSPAAAQLADAFWPGGLTLVLDKRTDAGIADLLVTVQNLSDHAFSGAVRAMLLPETEVAGEASLEAPALELGPGERATVALPIQVTHHFRCDFLRFGSYPSVPMTAEICWDQGSVLLSVAVKVT